MLFLHQSLQAWPDSQFAAILKAEIQALPPGSLPLAEGGALGGYVDDASIEATVLRYSELPDTLLAEVGIFFGEILAGCSCGDEPEIQNSYCELNVRINKHTALAHFSLRET
ncbi:MAG: hypothetical protein Q8M20_15610 [Rhodocyclaceae bacterium]|nr:hypothetical protein [Rhodocyclaceae bacterium]MDZ4215072.1 hypothetical protein [Rhodocyclaceae bacterium]